MIDLAIIENDDDRFIMMTASIITGIRYQFQPGSIRPIRINNWFGKNWYRFSGKVMGAFGISKHQLTIPPFVPSRVVEESYWVRDESGVYSRIDDFSPLHMNLSSEENMRRYFNAECSNSAVIWYSGGTKSNGRGSIMTYISSQKNDNVTWYVELVAPKNWMPSITQGITKNEFEEISGIK